MTRGGALREIGARLDDLDNRINSLDEIWDVPRRGETGEQRVTRRERIEERRGELVRQYDALSRERALILREMEKQPQ